MSQGGFLCGGHSSLPLSNNSDENGRLLSGLPSLCFIDCDAAERGSGVSSLMEMSPRRRKVMKRH